MVVGRAGARCEVCGAGRDREVQRWLEVHERWAYDDATRTQSLRRLICLCTNCHQTTHFGLANIQGMAEQACAHLLTVTRMSQPEVTRHIRAAFELWQERSLYPWNLDYLWNLGLDLLTGAGIELSPSSTESRPAASANGPRSPLRRRWS